MNISGALCAAWFLVAGPAWGQVEETVMDTSKAGMEAISKALGVECEHCHPTVMADGQPDYKAPSAMKATARHMQIHVVDAFVQKDGRAPTCMTCHQGRATFLPRDTSQALPSRLVGTPRTEIVDMMKSMQNDLGQQTCDTCHARRRNGRIDPVAPTPRKVTVRFMMDQFAGSLLHRDNGKPAACASCHRGKIHFLPRER